MTKPATKSDILAGMACGGLAPAMAAFVTNPADVAKTRLNMSRELQRGRVSSVVQCWRAIVAAEGLAGLQRGLGFVLVREASKNAFRLGLYEPLVSALDSAIRPAAARNDPVRIATPPAMTSRVAAGAISGGLAAFLCNPLDLLKTRIQLDPARGAGRTPREALQQLLAAEGLAGLWRRGVLANVARSATATSLGLPVNYRLKEAVNANAAQLPLLAARPAVRDAACALAAAVVVRHHPPPPLHPSTPTTPQALHSTLCATIHPAPFASPSGDHHHQPDRPRENAPLLTATVIAAATATLRRAASLCHPALHAATTATADGAEIVAYNDGSGGGAALSRCVRLCETRRCGRGRRRLLERILRSLPADWPAPNTNVRDNRLFATAPGRLEG